MAHRPTSNKGRSVLKQGVHKLRAMRPAQIRREAQRPFRLLLVGDGEADRQALGRVFIPEGLSWAERNRALESIASGALSTRAPATLRVCTPAAAAQGGLVVDCGNPKPGLLALLRAHPEYRLAIARAFPPLREILAHELIRSVAARNAAVAAMSALPDVIPTPLSLVLALGEMGSDTVLLTANQMLLAFELAALRGAEVGWRAQSGALLGIAAGGLGWRTLARELVGLIPAGVGLAAKAAIAYSGTVAVGTALWRVPQREGRREPPVMEDASTGDALASQRQSA